MAEPLRIQDPEVPPILAGEGTLAPPAESAGHQNSDRFPWRWQVRHKLRAMKMRLRFRLGLPSPRIPAGPEDEWEGSVRLRYAFAMMRHREKGPPSPPQPTGPEMSGVYTRCWHLLDRLARLAPLLPVPNVEPAPKAD